MDVLDKAMKPHPDAIISKVGDETVILHLFKSTYYGLDPVGTKIWEGLGGGALPRDVCRDLANTFNVEIETVESDAREFLNDLIKNELLVEA